MAHEYVNSCAYELTHSLVMYTEVRGSVFESDQLHTMILAGVFERFRAAEFLNPVLIVHLRKTHTEIIRLDYYFLTNENPRKMRVREFSLKKILPRGYACRKRHLVMWLKAKVALSQIKMHCTVLVHACACHAGAELRPTFCIAVASAVFDCMISVNTMRLPRLSTRADSFMIMSVSPFVCMKLSIDTRPLMLEEGTLVSKKDLKT